MKEYAEDDFKSFEPPEIFTTSGEYDVTPGPLDYGLSVVKGATKGALESVPFTTAGLLSLNAGLAFAPAAGPLAPIVPLASLGLGLYGGSFLEDDYKELLKEYGPEGLMDFMSPPLDTSLQPSFAGGETFGGGATFAIGAPLIKPVSEFEKIAKYLPRMFKKQPDFISKVFGQYGEQARNNPLGFGLSELGAATATGLGAGTAVKYFPDSPVARFFGEVTGGMLPGVVRGSLRTVPMSRDGFKAIKNKIKVSDATKEAKARNDAVRQLDNLFNDPDVIELMEQEGESLPDIIKLLREPSSTLDENNLITSSIKSGSKVLTSLEESLMQSDPAFTTVIKNRYRNLTDKYQKALSLLTKSGKPELVQLAAQLQNNFHLNLIDTRMINAEKNIANIQKNNFPADTPENRTKIGEVINFELTKSLKEMREAENQLFDLARKASFKKVRTKAKDDLEQISSIEESKTYSPDPQIEPEGFVPGLPKQTSLQKFEKLTTSSKEKPIIVTGTKVRPLITKPNKTVYAILDMIGNNRLDISKLEEKDLAIIKKLMGGEKKFRFNQKVFEKGMNTAEYRGIDLPEGVERGLPEGMLSQLEVNKNVGLDELANLRSSLLATIRSKQAGANPDFKLAGAVQEIQEAVLNDIQSLNIPEYNKAVSFSRMLNTYFKQRFPQEITRVDAKGATKLPAEVLLQNSMNTLSAASDKTTLKMLEVMDAVQLNAWQKSLSVLGEETKAEQIRDLFEKAYRDDSIQKVGDLSREAFLKKYMPIAQSVYQQGPVTSVNSALKQLLMKDAGTFFTIKKVRGADGIEVPQTVLDLDKLAKWRVNNSKIINKLEELSPGINKDLDNAETAANYFQDILNNKKTQETLLKEELFSNLIGESPTVAFQSALADPSGKKLKRLIDFLKLNTTEELAKTVGLTTEEVKKQMRLNLGKTQKEVLDGFKSSYFNYAISKSLNKNEKLDVGKFTQMFFNNKRDLNTDSIADTFLKEGIFDQLEYNNFKKAITEMGTVVDRLRKSDGSLGDFLEGQTAMEDLLTRYVGAQVAGQINPGGPGSLSFAATMIGRFKKIFEQMPMSKSRQVLQDAIKNPELMADLLESSYEPTKKNLNVLQRIIGTLVGNGILPGSVATINFLKEDVETEFENLQDQFEILPSYPEVEPISVAPGLPRNVPRGPRTRGTEMPDTGIDSKLLSSARPTGASNQSSRQMLQSLFPLDPVLGAGRPPTA